MKKSIVIIVFAVILSSFCVVFTGEWKAPFFVDNIHNPLVEDTKATNKGKKLFLQMCAICHGAKGEGNGIAGASLNPRPADFSIDNIQKQSDGAIYWKLTVGRAPMAGYKSILKEDQRWQLVNYIRTFKK